jgi:hypothetical protein
LFQQKPIVALHLGAHKTATTYMQSRLYKSREVLRENGIAYIPLEDLRSLVTTKLNQSVAPSTLAECLRPYLACDRLILSDENILGGTNKPIHNSMYSNAKRRVEILLAALSDFDVSIFITVRSYADYFVSRYAEFLRHHPFMAFERYYKDIDFETVSWLDVIGQVKMAGAKSITISAFENTFEDEQAYLDLLLGKQGIVIESADDSPAIRRSKFSQQGYEIIKCYAEKYAVGSINKLMWVLDNNRQETQATTFMPFSEKQQLRLSDRYAAELAFLLNCDGTVNVSPW